MKLLKSAMATLLAQTGATLCLTTWLGTEVSSGRYSWFHPPRPTPSLRPPSSSLPAPQAHNRQQGDLLLAGSIPSYPSAGAKCLVMLVQHQQYAHTTGTKTALLHFCDTGVLWYEHPAGAGRDRIRSWFTPMIFCSLPTQQVLWALTVTAVADSIKQAAWQVILLLWASESQIALLWCSFIAIQQNKNL